MYVEEQKKKPKKKMGDFYVKYEQQQQKTFYVLRENEILEHSEFRTVKCEITMWNEEKKKHVHKCNGNPKYPIHTNINKN